MKGWIEVSNVDGGGKVCVSQIVAVMPGDRCECKSIIYTVGGGEILVYGNTKEVLDKIEGKNKEKKNENT